MLSFTRGKPIAELTEKDKKKSKKNKTINLYGADDFSNKQKSDITIPTNENSQLLDNFFFKENKISKQKRDTVKDIVDGKKPRDNLSSEMKEYIELADKEILTKLKTQIDL